MRIEELQPGLYKVQKCTRAMFEDEASFNSVGSFHILTVKCKGNTKSLQIDNGMEEALKDFVRNHEDDYQVISRLQDYTEVHKPSISIRWKDEKGDSFSFLVRDVWALKSVFQQFHFLARSFNYLPNKSKEAKVK